MRQLISAWLLMLCCAATGTASGAFILGATRVVYQQGDDDVTLSVQNTSSVPYVGQAWVEPNSEDRVGIDEDAPPAFVVTPSLFKLGASDARIIRFLDTGSALPGDRESVFWINVQEIPPEAKSGNVVQFAQRIKIKLFYRPAALADKSPLDSLPQLRATVSDGVLAVDNPTPFSVSFFSASVSGRGGEALLPELRMVMPFSRVEMPAPDVGIPERFSFDYINDYGGRRTGLSLEIR